MDGFKTIESNSEKSFVGEMKVLSTNGYDIKVRLMMLNGKKNRNNWIYENLSEHLNEFKGIPLLISYKDGQLGAGHEMDMKRNPDGSLKPSFMSAEAERIVGYIPESASIRLETIEGVDWVVTDDAIVFGWYAPELAERLKGTGNLTQSEKVERAMNVSIETLIDKGTKEADGTEIFTKWRVLGVTLLSDNTNPAVESANIRALSAIGVDGLREMTNLRVAQANEEAQKSANKNKKGVKEMTKMLNIEDLKAKFNGYTVLAVNGLNVALLSDKGRTYSYSFNENEDTVVPERITEVAVNSVFGEGDGAVSVTAEQLVGVMSAKLNASQHALEEKTAECATLTEKINAMEAEELKRRKEAVKTAINSRLDEIKTNCNGLEVDSCEDLLADEKVAEYASIVDKDKKFCGDEVARKDVDARCMAKILEKKMLKANSTKVFAWDIAKDEASKNEAHGIEKSVANILKD